MLELGFFVLGFALIYLLSLNSSQLPLIKIGIKINSFKSVPLVLVCLEWHQTTYFLMNESSDVSIRCTIAGALFLNLTEIYKFLISRFYFLTGQK